MATVTRAYDHSRDPMRPEQLASEVKAALALGGALPVVDIDPTAINVTHASIVGGHAAAIQTVIDAYVFDPNWTGVPGTPEGNHGELRAKGTQALAVNSAFLAITNPTNAQATAQVKALTRQVNALIRLTLGLFDSTSDT